MQIVSTVIARPVDACWQTFTDPTALVRWVPGLRDAATIEARPDGLAAEVQFVFGADLVYSLQYSYDVNARVVRWKPRPGEHGAVRGFARFEPVDGGTQLTYALEHEAGRKALDRAIDHPRTLVDAFARLMYDS